MIGATFSFRFLVATLLTVLLAGGVAWFLADASVAAGLWWGGLAGVVYLALLARWSWAFIARSKGERVGLLDRLILLGGRAARMGWVALAFIAGLKAPVPMNLVALIVGLLIYRILLFGVMAVEILRSSSEKTSTK